MELSFRLEVFEGPLDLLLHLIAKHKLNIHDIEITVLLEQYLVYMDVLEETDVELAGEFLEMAARLIYIKTVSLLPVHEEADELRRELSGALIEYSLCKLAAERLRRQFCGFDLFVREPAPVQIDPTYRRLHQPMELLAALRLCAGKEGRRVPPPEELFRPLVSHRVVSVTSRIVYVLRLMYKRVCVGMDELFVGLEDRSERVATFLAVLELSKSGRIRINDDNSRIDFDRTKRRTQREPVLHG